MDRPGPGIFSCPQICALSSEMRAWEARHGAGRCRARFCGASSLPDSEVNLQLNHTESSVERIWEKLTSDVLVTIITKYQVFDSEKLLLWVGRRHAQCRKLRSSSSRLIINEWIGGGVAARSYYSECASSCYHAKRRVLLSLAFVHERSWQRIADLNFIGDKSPDSSCNRIAGWGWHQTGVSVSRCDRHVFCPLGCKVLEIS